MFGEVSVMYVRRIEKEKKEASWRDKLADRLPTAEFGDQPRFGKHRSSLPGIWGTDSVPTYARECEILRAALFGADALSLSSALGQA